MKLSIRVIPSLADADPAARLSSDELLECCGPQWSLMTPDEREAYGPRRPVVPLAPREVWAA